MYDTIVHSAMSLCITQHTLESLRRSRRGAPSLPRNGFITNQQYMVVIGVVAIDIMIRASHATTNNHVSLMIILRIVRLLNNTNNNNNNMFFILFDPEGLPYKFMVFAPEVDR